MRRILIAMAMLLPMVAVAQDHMLRVDTAARIVDRYVRILNFDALSTDSMLVAETLITTNGSPDTFVMRRWYARGVQHRVEVWRGRTLVTAFCSNGKDRYRKYKPDLGYWVDITPDKFYAQFIAYDLRGPLYGWREAGCELTYRGTVNTMGAELESVRVEASGRYTRNYLFERSGLLALIVEHDEMPDVEPEMRPENARIEWKCEHEYLPVGPCILPVLESFSRQGRITVQRSTIEVQPFQSLTFNADRL